MKILFGYANIFSRDLIIQQCLASHSHMEMIPANKISEMVDMIKRGMTPELIIIDSGLPDMRGLSGLSKILECCQRSIPVAVMGAPASHSEMRMVLDAGAAGYIPKSIGIKVFFSALTMMAEGEVFMPAESSAGNADTNFLPPNWLTGREKDMLDGLLAGKSNKEIARVHGLSEVTVKHHLKSLRGKLGARNRTHAVCRAIELGIVPGAA